MNFEEAERRYAELKRQVDAGIISVNDFNAERQRLMVQDDEGRWWARSPNDDEWNYYDGATWVPATSPDEKEVIRREVREVILGQEMDYNGTIWMPTASPSHQEVVLDPSTSSARTLLLPHPKGAEHGENGHQNMLRWIPVAGLIGILLVGIVLIWVPYLRGELEASKQGGSTPSGAAFDSTFIHRATFENISKDPEPDSTTYFDNPLINNNPNAILYVTQSWSPEGSGGTYNPHPIGVWYNNDRQRWAIFNQDEASMPKGATFNVAVLKDPTKAR